jgi:hypothetical protein
MDCSPSVAALTGEAPPLSNQVRSHQITTHFETHSKLNHLETGAIGEFVVGEIERRMIKWDHTNAKQKNKK